MFRILTLSFLTSLFSLLTYAASSTSFARGADISWCTEMEADGKTFRNADGQQRDIFLLMKEIGMNAIRLRVWVNPQRFGYGPWCDKTDVLAKARRAHAQGLDLLIDFHYSDFFADPGRQNTPLDWTGYTTQQLTTAVAQHTKDILQALKDEGITPRWVQVGNETNNGMIWDAGKINWNLSGSARFNDYARLSNAAYDAVKQIMPETQVIIHYAGAYNAAAWNCWFFNDFLAAGGKFDIIGLSHYPDYNNWNSDNDDAVSNANAAKNIKGLTQQLHVPVMIVETGYSAYDTQRAATVMSDLYNKIKDIPLCIGLFYWEPEVDGQWKPAYYKTVGWNAYSMGAFTTDGRPTPVLDIFKGEADGISHTATRPTTEVQCYDLQGRPLTAPRPGLIIKRNALYLYPRNI